MRSSPWTRRCLAWIAALSIGLGAAAPTLSQAALAARGDATGHQWVQVCSASGMTWVRLDASEPGDHSGGAQWHCPWCVLQAAMADVPPVHALWAPIAVASAEPAAPVQRVRDATPLGHAQPRGPPWGL